MNRRYVRMSLGLVIILVALFNWTSHVLADSPDDPTAAWQPYDKQITNRQTLATFGPDLFGDHVDLQSGALSFSATDISIPGNNALPVEFKRSLQISNQKDVTVVDRAFKDWDIDVPRLEGTFATTWQNDRCSGTGVPADIYVQSHLFRNDEYWSGTQAKMPGGGELLQISSSPLAIKPSTGGPYKWMTAGQVYLSCLSSLKYNAPGEGFLAIAPDGTKYWFDVMAQYFAPQLKAKITVGNTTDMVYLPRQENVLYVSRVEDRFGNYVNYTYTNNYNQAVRLTSIDSSDGRHIGITYTAEGKVDTASTDSAHTWVYGYGPGTLTTVTLPDASQWKIDFSQLAHTAIKYLLPSDPSESVRSCYDPGDVVSTGATGTITHPSGAVGTFTVDPIRHGRSNVPAICSNWGAPPYNSPNDDETYYLINWDSLSLTSKQVSGPGLQAGTWQYSYNSVSSYFLPSGNAPVCPQGMDCSQPQCVSDMCAKTDTTVVTGPDSQWTRYTFGNSYRYNEGKLLKTERGTSATDIKSVTTTSYNLAQSGQLFPTPIGTGIRWRGDAFSEEYPRPEVQTDLVQDGVTFTSQVPSTCGSGSNTPCFDAFVRPTTIKKSSTLGYSRTEATAYADNTPIWVLGQVAKVTCMAATPANAACDGDPLDSVESQTTYDSTYALPLTRKSFGKLQQTLTYDTTSTVASNLRGTLKTVADGNGNVTTLSGWFRGVPTLVTYPATTDQPTPATMSASVNNFGWITSVVDENGYATGYGYDAMGRLESIHYPENDSTVWNDTTIVYQAMATAEYGIPAGHWKRTESTGDGRKVTYFDAMWRPLVEEQYDAGDAANTRSLSVKRYDASGHTVFQGYPVAALPNGYADGTLTGSTTTYDALDRTVQVAQDWEGTGKLTTTTAYLTGFKTQVTNPRTYKTVTSYMAFDQPTTDWPVNIQAADTTSDEAVTDIARDVFGKPTAIVRHNVANTLSETRSYVYDPNQLLCKTVEPETGATIVAYDGANNVVWSAGGQTYTGTTGCDAASVANGVKVNRTYDARNRLKLLRFPDGRGDQDLSYWPDGLPNQITTYNAAGQGAPLIDSYHYNKRRMPDGVGESLEWPGWYTWSVGHGYDGNGHLSTQIYPEDPSNNLEVSYAPNALGQPKQVANPGGSTYVSGVTYYPNGAIKHFVYGNGIVHDMHQNARLLPDWSKDTDGTTNVLYDNYVYDNNGNVAQILDGVPGAHGDRHMVYDALDRLKSADSPMFGNGVSGQAAFTYDALDNLTQLTMPATANSPARTQYYCYDTSWRLASLRSAANCGGTVQTSLTYDAQGNLWTKGSQSYSFGKNNRLYQTTGKELYRYDAQGHRVLQSASAGNILSQYSQDGQLLQITDTRAGYTSSYLSLGGSLVAVRKKSIAAGTITVQYQHTDALGTPVVVTTGTKGVLERSEYEPYGQLLNRPLTDGPGFTGHVQDAQTGLTYMQQRYYDPMIGRFLSTDPVAATTVGGNFNRYWYGNDNPYRFTDPDGRDAFYFADKNILVIPVYFSGSGATPENINLIRARINSVEAKGGMRTVLQVLSKPGGVGTNVMDLSPRLDFNYGEYGEGLRWGEDVGGRHAHINSNSGNWIGAAAHDIYHFAGAPDGYRDVGGNGANRMIKMLQGYSKADIMADRSGNRLLWRDVEAIKKNETTFRPPPRMVDRASMAAGAGGVASSLSFDP